MLQATLQRATQQFLASSCMQQHLVALLLTLLLLQQVDVLKCRHIAGNKRYMAEEVDGAPASTSAGVAAASSATGELVDKRTLIAGSGNSALGQPEEIFSLSDNLESNYDEYPMVVPKRAALLLDRLMVALHHALEKERRRIDESYDSKTGGFKPKNKEAMAAALGQQSLEEHEQGSPHYNMYSDDDPSVIMDYDFKDLNAINRATGETLMAKSFQRRANVGDIIGAERSDSGVAMLTSAAGSAAAAAAAGGTGGGGGGGGVGVGRNNIGRMYWRCYFNAVSCF